MSNSNSQSKISYTKICNDCNCIKTENNKLIDNLLKSIDDITQINDKQQLVIQAIEKLVEKNKSVLELQEKIRELMK